MTTRIFLLFFLSLSGYLAAQTAPVRNSETEQVYALLKKVVRNKQIMFGMANPTTIGFADGPLNGDYNVSDCKNITGDHPAFHESDFMWYEENPTFQKWDVKAMKEAWKRGAVLGYCWHIGGPESRKFYAMNDGVVSKDYNLAAEITANPDRNTNSKLDWYLTRIDSVAIPVFKELNCPLVFRPFHEMTGEWFWWGRQIGADNYVKLFRLTVDYLRNKGIDNLLYCWSPDKFVDFSFYPGDAYVDVLGLDIYEPGLTPHYPKEKLIENLTIICDYAAAHDKVAAWTEVGLRPTDEGVSRYPEQYPDFWTTYVWDVVTQNPAAGRLAWISSWYNADWKKDFSSSPYIPYKGMKKTNAKQAIQDFIKMYDYPNSLFEKDLKKLRNSAQPHQN